MTQNLRVTLINPGSIVPELHYGPYSFYCSLHVVTESSPTKAIFTVYKDCFNTSTRYSGYQVMGWNNKNILETLKKNIQYIPISINIENCRVFIYGIRTSSRKKWGYADSGFQSSLLHSKCELSAWQTMLKAVGVTNITPWTHEESQYQLWTKSPNGEADKVAFATLYRSSFLTSTSKKSHKHVYINGYEAPLLVKPIIRQQRFIPEMLKQINTFLNDKEFVNMNSYKTDAKTGKLIKYLQDTKKALWERFTKEYPNGMYRTSFMTCLKGGQYVYQENLGGLCSTCNNCIWFLKILGHCIRHAFGDCNLNHPVTCSKCESLFSFFQELKAVISEEYFEVLDKYQQKLIAWMAHYARKTYLNIHVRINLEELDGEGDVMIVDYKMRILPQSSQETKTEFFGKRGWSFYFVLVYTKNMEQNQLDIQIFDHWFNDTRQDA
ncbi:hypothetical protein RclHR1_19590001 [Rhizophagus clarus]|uniref:C2H2-type domain-containing protein n=1 Tax=Rhizophagus clarus TaxID=94130 RepID=A0A2Z6QRE8_9GLOM|nr:hypothetical protein RclHR1_19590001 [Rhizophagus clarus]